MFRIAICEDMKKDRDLLFKLVNETCSILNMDNCFEIYLFTCGEDLENHYSDENCPMDIIFLDIYMRGKTGIDTAREIRKYDNMCKIIFTTTSTDHALDGYSVFAYNYLVKPICAQTFVPVFKKALNDTGMEKQKTLYVKTGAKIQSVPYSGIVYMESCGKKIKIYTIQGFEITTYSKLDEIESTINDIRFLRCHKSFLVNMDFVKNVEQYNFTLRDNTTIPIRQKGFSQIKKAYYAYILKTVDLS